jgi:hypothetical protein
MCSNARSKIVGTFLDEFVTLWHKTVTENVWLLVESINMEAKRLRFYAGSVKIGKMCGYDTALG